MQPFLLSFSLVFSISNHSCIPTPDNGFDSTLEDIPNIFLSKSIIMKRPASIFAIILLKKPLIKTLFICLLIGISIKSYSQPNWVTGPNLTDITAISVDLEYELDVASDVYITVYRNDVRPLTSAEVKLYSGYGDLPPARPFARQFFNVSGYQLLYIENLKPSTDYTLSIVAEAGGQLQGTPVEFYFTTPECPTIAPFTALTSLDVCVNNGATKVYNFLNLEPPINVYKGCEWTIDWGDGSPLYTYTSTANGDVPPNQPHTYTTHDSCYYEIVLTATNPGACATVGGLQKTEAPILAGRDIDADGNGEMLLVNLADGSPDTIKVCEGTEAFITLQDDGTWDCDENFKTYPPGEINSDDRDLQFVYGMHHQTQAVENTITGDISITGTYPGTANTTSGHASGIINIDTDFLTTIENPNTNSDLIRIPPTCQYGEYMHVYLKNWNKCNPYSGDPWDGTAVWDSIVIFIEEGPIADAGSDFAICEDGTANMNGSIHSAATTAEWTTTGDGSFTNETSPDNAVYTPGSNDITAGFVDLVLHAYGIGLCPEHTDTMSLTINPLPDVITGTTTICLGSTTTLSSATPGGTWSSASPGVATVNAGGVVTGVSGGTADILYTLPTGCFVSETVTVRPTPTASISGNTTVCEGGASPDITFTNPMALPVTITYNINGGGNTTVDVAAGSSTDVAAPTGSAGTFNYNLVDVFYQSAPNCTNGIVGTATAIVRPTPTASISGDATVCEGGASPDITFTNPMALPVTITYNINGGGNATVDVAAGSSTDVAAPTGTDGTFNYNLVNVFYQGAPGCTNSITGTSTIIVRPTPTANISGDATVCEGDAFPDITFTNPMALPVTITYNINGGGNTTIDVGGSSSTTVSAPTGVPGTYNYNLVDVFYQSTPTCSNGLLGTATVTVRPTPTATVGGTTTVCQGDPSPDITFTNPNALPIRVRYRINGGSSNSINVPGGSSVDVPAPTGTAGTFVYTFRDIRYQDDSPGCQLTPPGSATITVRPTPTASISGTTSVCEGDPSPDITFTNPMSDPVTVTYNINGGADQTVNVGGSSTTNVAVPTGTDGTFTYSLVNVFYQAGPNCANVISGTAIVTVRPTPTATISGDATVCEDDVSPNITFTNPMSDPVTVTYKIDGGANQTVNIGGSTNETVPVPTGTAGTFVYSLVDVFYQAGPSCANGLAGTATVNVNPNPTPIITGANNVCANVTGELYSTPDVVGNTYVWAISGGVITSGAGTNEITVTWGAAGAGWVRVTETITATGCVVTTSDYNVTINPGAPSTAPSLVSGETDICDGGTLNIDVSDVATAVEYIWDYSWVAGTNNATTADSEISIDLSALAPGPYSVTVAGANGCGLGPWMAPVHTFSINAIPDLSALSDVTCSESGNSLTLAIDNAGDYEINTVTYTIDNINNNGLTDFDGTDLTGEVNQAADVLQTDTWVNKGTSDVDVLYTIIPVSDKGCSGPGEVVTLTVEPEADLTDNISNTVCSGDNSALNLSINNGGGDVGAVTYTVTNLVDNGLTDLDGTDRSAASGGSGVISTEQWLNNTANDVDVVYTIQPEGTNGCPGEEEIVTLTVEPQADLTDNITNTVCSGVNSGITLSIANGGGDVGAVTYTVTNINDNGLTDLDGTDRSSASGGAALISTEQWLNTTANDVDVVYTIQPEGTNGCTGEEETVTLTVEPQADLTDNITNTVCSGVNSGLTLSIANGGGDVGAVTYTVTNLNDNGLTDLDGTDRSAASGGTGILNSEQWLNTTANDVDVVYTIQPVGANGCTGAEETVTLTVEPQADLTDNITNTVCSGANSGIALSIANGGGDVGAVTYTVTNLVDNGLIDLDGTDRSAASGGSGIIGTEQWLNITANDVDVVYTIQPVGTNGCTGEEETVTLTVEPQADLTDNITNTVCSGVNSAITLSIANGGGDVGAVTYTVTNLVDNGLTDLDGTDRSAASGGSGLISTEQWLNTTSNDVDVVYTIQPIGANGCTGAEETVTLTVEPQADLTDNITNTVCSRSNSGITLSIANGGGDVGAVTYTVTNLNDNGLTDLDGTDRSAASGGAGLISTEQWLNTTANNVDVVYTIQPVGANGCAGEEETVTLTVEPQADLTDNISSNVCSGANSGITLSIANGGGDVGAVTYTVTNLVDNGLTDLDGTDRSAASGGTGIISTEQWLNTTANDVDVVYTILPDGANGCPSYEETVTVTVKPQADLTDNITNTVCSGANSAITLSIANGGGDVGAVTYTVTNITDNGLTDIDGTDRSAASGGSGLISTEQWLNTTAGDVDVVYTIQPEGANGCTGEEETVTLTVEPQADLTDNIINTVCSGANSALTLSITNDGADVGAVTYTVTNLNANGLTDLDGTDRSAASGGAGILSNEQWLNKTANDVDVVYTVQPEGANGCTGEEEIVTLTVEPQADLTDNITNTVCSGANSGLTLSIANGGGDVGAVTYTVTNLVDNGLTDLDGTDRSAASGGSALISTEQWLNITGSDVDVVYTIVPEGANGCTGAAETVTLTVKPEPVITAGQNPAACSGNALDYKILLDNFTNPGDNVTFTWLAPVLNPVDPGFTGGTARVAQSAANITDTFTNTTGAIGTATYTVTPYFNGCEGDPVDIVVQVGAEPVLDPNLDKFACSDTPIALTLQEETGSVTPSRYNIISVTVDPDLTAGGSNATIPEANADASYLENDQYTNTSGSNQDVVYRVQPILDPDCFGDPVDVTVTIRPEPVIQPVQVKTVCSGVAVNKEILLLPVNTPAGTTFDWPQPTMSDGSTQGTAGVGVAADPAGTFHITDVLSNFTGADITATYYVTPTSANGCVGEEVAVEITVQSQPVTSVITGESTLCVGAENEVYSVDNTPGSSYNWTVPANMTVVFDDNVNFIIVDATAAGSDNVEVVETNIDGCVGLPEVLPVTVSNYATAETVSGPDVVCKGETNVAYSVPDNAGSTYQWYVPAGVTVTSDPAAHEIFVDFNLDSGGDISVVETNSSGCTTVHDPITVTVNSINSGSIGSDQAVCSGVDPAAFISNTDASGDGTVTYQWQESTDNVNFTDIGGATNSTYDEGIIAQTKYYKRIATSSLGGKDCSAESNVVAIYLNEVDPGQVGSDQTICEGDFAAGLTSITNGSGSGAITYQWQDSPDNITFTDIPGETFSALSPGSLTADRYYKRITISTLLGTPCEAESNVVTVTVNNFDPGSISAAQTICEGDTPVAFTSVSPTGDGAFSYQWRQSTDGVTYTDTGGALNETYAPGALTQDTWYKRIVTSSLNSTDCIEETVPVKVTVINFNPGSISTDQTICEGGTPAALNSVAPSGDGAFTYQWQESIDGSAYTDIIGETGATFNPPALTQDTWYKRIVTASLNGSDCDDETNAVKITVNNFDPGSISADQTICEGTAPAALTSVTPTGDGTFTYQWMSSIDGTNFNNITGATSETYSPPALTQDTWYKRAVTSTLNGVLCTEETNVVEITVNNFDPGSISADQTICEGANANPFTSVTPTGDFASVAYQWYSSTDGSTFNPIGGATTETYDPGALTVDTWYKREVTATLNGVPCIEETNTVKVTVINFDPGSIDANQTICEGSNANALTSVSPTGDGSFTYQWYESADGSTFTPLAGVTGETYNPGALTADTWYKREVTATLNGHTCTEETNVVRITVNNFDPGSISADQTICEGDTPAALTSVDASGDGAFGYQWQISTNGSTYSDIGGATAATYAPGALTQDTWYKRIVTSSLNGTDCIEETAPVKITVINFTPGSISSDQTICEGGTPNPLTSVSPSGDGTFTYQWQESADGIAYSNIGGETGVTFSPPALTADTWYKRIVTSSLNGTDCDDETNAVKITVNNMTPGAIGTDETICEGAVPTPLTVTTTATVDGTITYQWQSSTDGTNFFNITGATSDTYSPPALTADTWYKRSVTSSLNGVLCTEETNVVQLTVNNFDPGSISADQTICEGANANPFTSVTPTGDFASVAYQWYSSTDGSTFNPIGGATTETYDPGALTVDTWYKREVTATLNGVPCIEETNTVKVTVINFDPGSIDADQTICEGSNANSLSSVAPTGDGSFTYQWYESADGSTFTPLAGVTGETYNPGALTADTWYKREVTATLNGHTCTEETNVVRITVNNFDPGSISADQTICEGDTPVALTSVDASGDGAFGYQWQISTNGSTYSDIGGATAATYAPGALTQDTWYKRIVTSSLNGTDCIEETAPVKITVINFTPGSISSDQTICEGGTPNPLTSVSPSGDGTFTYQWQESADGIAYSNIGGETGETFSPPSLTVDTWYKRIVTSSLNGTDCDDETNAVKITVNNMTPGVIEADQTICEGSVPAAITVNTAATADGTITYQWQSSTDGTNFFNITGATSDTYSPPALTADTWYKRVVNSSLNGVICTEETNAVKVNVNNFDPGSIDADQTICEGANANPFTSVTPTGDFVSVAYQWYSSTDGTTFNPIGGATTETYDPGALTVDTWYKREVTATLNGVPCIEETNIVKVTVINFDPGSIDADQTICEGSNANSLTSVSPTGDGSFSYQWYSSTDGTNFNPVAGAIYETYNPGALTVDTWYKRAVTASLNGTDCTEETNTVKITVINFNEGSIGSDQTICEGATPAALTSTTPTGDGTFTYQWQESTNGVNYTDIVGANGETYAPGALTQDTWYKRIVTASESGTDCIVENTPVKITVINFLPGSIASDQTICEGDTPNPLTAINPNGDGTFTYQWQSSTDGSNFSNITGETGATYSPPALTQDTWYKRIVTASLNGTDCTDETNAVRITVNNFDPGIIDADQTICEGGTPAGITTTIPASGDGAFTYQWLQSTDGTNFSTVSGATTDAYNPPALTQDRWYKLEVTSTLNAIGCIEETNTVKITVNNLDPGSINADQTICEGDTPAEITSVTPTGDFSSVSYRWFESTDGSTFSLVAGETTETLSPPALTQDTWYKREVTASLNGVDCIEETNTVKVTVINFDPGSIDADQTICDGSAATVFTSVTPSGDGSFTYQWQSSTDGVTFTDIPGANFETYNAGILTQDTYFKRLVTANLNGQTCTEETNVITVTVVNFDPGSIGSDQTICEGEVPAALTSVTPTGDGAFGYQWKESTDGFTFTDIGGATGETYTPPALTQDHWYKRVVTASLNGTDCTAETNTVKVTVNNLNPGTIGTDKSICFGDDPVGFISLAPASGDGAITYQWQISTDNVTFTDIGGATGVTYDEGALVQTTYYKRIAISTLNGVDCTAESNVITVTVNPLPVADMSGDAAICPGTATDIYVNVTTGTGPYLLTINNGVGVVSNYTSGDPIPVVPMSAPVTYELQSIIDANGCEVTAPHTNITGSATITFLETVSIDVQPVSQEICENNDVTFSVTATGETPYSYQWYENGSPMAGETGSTLSLTAVPASMSGNQYFVDVTGGCGNTVRSDLAILTVNTETNITVQPSDTTICEFSATAFGVTATGSGLTYQWQGQAPSESSFTDLVGSGTFIGVNTSNLQVYGADRTMSGYRFRVVVGGTCSADLTSAEAVLTVNTAPEIVSNPSDTTVCEGFGGMFVVEAAGDSLEYQWFVNNGGGFVALSDDANHTGSDDDTLYVTNVGQSMNGWLYRAVVSGVCSPDAYSSFAVLAVEPLPVVTQQPLAQEICEGLGATFLAYATGTGVSYQWQYDDGGGWTDLSDGGIYTGTQTQQLRIDGAPVSASGTIRVEVVTDCQTIYSDEVLFTVNDNPVVDFSGIDPVLACGGVDTQLDGNPTGGSGTFTTHSWTGQVGPLDDFTRQDPVFNTTMPGTYNLTYTVTDNNGCMGSDNLGIEVEKPTAAFTPSPTSGCTPLDITMTDGSSGAVNYSWDFGDGSAIDNTAGNVTHQYTNTTQSVYYYDVKLEVESANGCLDSMIRGITVYPEIDADFEFSEDTICSGEMVYLNSLPGAYQYYWEYGDSQSEYGANVTSHMFVNTGTAPATYTVRLTTTSFYGCTDFVEKDIVVYPVPTPLFTASPASQTWPAATVDFTNNTNTGSWDYLWRFGDGTTSTLENPTHEYTTPGDYKVWLIVSNAFCSDSIDRNVSVLPTPPVAAFDSVPPACGPHTVTMTNNSQYGETYLWEFGDGGISTAENPTYTYYESGIFRITLTVTGPGGTDVESKLVEVWATPRAYFEVAPDFVYVGDERVRCFNLSEGASSFIWEFGDGDTSQMRDPYHKYMEEGVFDITLHAYSDNGCYDTYTLSPAVTVEPAGEITFANVFRPNKEGPLGDDVDNLSSDQIDQMFFPPVKEQVSEYKLQIFSRAGVLLFQSNSINKGWDGYYKGRLVMQGVYVWYVEGKYANGKPFKKTGDITLLH